MIKHVCDIWPASSLGVIVLTESIFTQMIWILGLVPVWLSLLPKFNSFDLDSEVGRLVKLTLAWCSLSIILHPLQHFGNSFCVRFQVLFTLIWQIWTLASRIKLTLARCNLSINLHPLQHFGSQSGESTWAHSTQTVIPWTKTGHGCHCVPGMCLADICRLSISGSSGSSSDPRILDQRSSRVALGKEHHLNEILHTKKLDASVKIKTLKALLGVFF